MSVLPFPHLLKNQILYGQKKKIKSEKHLVIKLIHFARAAQRGLADDNPMLKYDQLQIMMRCFLTHDKTSGWRRGATNSVLVGLALLASGWAFHGLA